MAGAALCEITSPEADTLESPSCLLASFSPPLTPHHLQEPNHTNSPNRCKHLHLHQKPQSLGLPLLFSSQLASLTISILSLYVYVYTYPTYIAVAALHCLSTSTKLDPPPSQQGRL